MDLLCVSIRYFAQGASDIGVAGLSEISVVYVVIFSV